MCTWMTDIPLHSKQNIGEKKKNLMLFIRPTEGNDVYRFRLLGFESKTSDRDTPYIQRFVHSVWVKDKNGKSHTESVVCPVTPYVKEHWEGNPMDTCPICKFANLNYIAYQNSNWTDTESNKKNKEYGRKFEVLIPVYVVSDPTYPLNNNQFRVIGLYTKEDFEKFSKLIWKERHENKNQVFNGVEAVDFVIQMKTVKEEKKKKSGETYTWTHNVISRMGFLKTPKAIPAITKEAIDKFPFDEEFWQYPTMDDLNAFYDKHIKHSMSEDDLPPEDLSSVDEVFGDGEKKEAPKEENPVVEKTNSIEKSEKTSNTEMKAEEPLSELPFEDSIDELPEETPKEEMKVEEEEEKLPEPEKEKSSSITTDSELDDFLSKI